MDFASVSIFAIFILYSLSTLCSKLIISFLLYFTSVCSFRSLFFLNFRDYPYIVLSIVSSMELFCAVNPLKFERRIF